MRKAYFFLITLLIVFMSISVISLNVTSAEEEFGCFVLDNNSTYNISGNGGDFYITFKRNGEKYSNDAIGELGRIAYTIMNLSYEKKDDTSMYFFSLSHEKLGSNVNESQMMKVDSTKAVECLIDECRCNSLLLYKQTIDDKISAIIRNGVEEYTQSLVKTISDDTYSNEYGVYISGFYGQFSFTPLYSMGAEVRLYKDSSITVSKDGSIDVQVSYDNCMEATGNAFYKLISNENTLIIPHSVNKSTTSCSTVFDYVEVNGKKDENAKIVSDGSLKVLYLNASDGDKITIKYIEQSVETDEAEIYDLYNILGDESMTFEEETQITCIGSIEDKVNTAFRFKYYAPDNEYVRQNGWSSYQINKFAVWAEGSFWSYSGYIITFFGNDVEKIRILTGQEVLLAKSSCSAITIGSINTIEIGVVKGYEVVDGIKGDWTFNRVYVKVDGVIACYYDDYNKQALGSSVYGPYLEKNYGRYGKCTISDARNLCKIENEDNGFYDVSLSYNKYVVSGEDAEILITEKDGYKISSIFANGENVTKDVEINGAIKKLVLRNIQEDIVLTYIVSENEYVEVNVESDSNAYVDYEGLVLYGNSAKIKLLLNKGYSVKKFLVNGIDRKSDLLLDDDGLTYNISAIKEDIDIIVSTEEKEYTISYEMENGYVQVLTTAIKAGTAASFIVKVAEGYKVTGVLVNGKTVENVSGVFIVENVNSDLNVVVTTSAINEETEKDFRIIETNNEETGCNSSICMEIFMGLGIYVLLMKKRESK